MRAYHSEERGIWYGLGGPALDSSFLGMTISSLDKQVALSMNNACYECPF